MQYRMVISLVVTRLRVKALGMRTALLFRLTRYPDIRNTMRTQPSGAEPDESCGVPMVCLSDGPSS